MVSLNSAAPVANNAAQQSCGFSNFCSSACDKVSSFARAAISTFADLPAQWSNAGFFGGTAAWTVANPLAAAVVVVTTLALVYFTYRYFTAEAPAANNSAPAATTAATPASTAATPASTAATPASTTEPTATTTAPVATTTEPAATTTAAPATVTTEAVPAT